MTDEVGAAGAARQLPAEPGDQPAAGQRRRAARRARALDPRARARAACSTARSSSCRATRSSPSAASAGLGPGAARDSRCCCRYSKIALNQQLLAVRRAGGPVPGARTRALLPAPRSRERYRDAIGSHRLRREIIATATTNSLVNRMGPTLRAARAAGHRRRRRRRSRAPTASRARSSTCARCWARIEALDNRVAAAVQYAMTRDTSACCAMPPTG